MIAGTDAEKEPLEIGRHRVAVVLVVPDNERLWLIPTVQSIQIWPNTVLIVWLWRDEIRRRGTFFVRYLPNLGRSSSYSHTRELPTPSLVPCYYRYYTTDWLH